MYDEQLISSTNQKEFNVRDQKRDITALTDGGDVLKMWNKELL